MQPHITIVVRGGVVQEVASDTPNVLIKLLDMDSIDEGDPPEQWRPLDVVITDPQDFDAYTVIPPHNNPVIPGSYLRAIECTHMRVDAHGMAWTWHPKHLDTDVRTSAIPWEVIEEQRLFAPPQLDR